MKWFDGTLLKMSFSTFCNFIKLMKLHSTATWVSPRDRVRQTVTVRSWLMSSAMSLHCWVCNGCSQIKKKDRRLWQRSLAHTPAKLFTLFSSWNQKIYTKFIENISDGVTVSTFELILSVVVHGLHGYIEIKIPFALVLQWWLQTICSPHEIRSKLAESLGRPWKRRIIIRWSDVIAIACLPEIQAEYGRVWGWCLVLILLTSSLVTPVVLCLHQWQGLQHDCILPTVPTARAALTAMTGTVTPF